MPPFELRTLSGVALVSPDGTELLGPGKPLALLVYLACSPGRSAGREHLVDLLWADLPADKARHALRQTIWYLRQILGAALEPMGTEVALVLNLSLDRDRFREAVEQSDLESAVSVYRSDFLAHFAVPGGLDFEHWADVERQSLRAAFLRAIEQLARRQLDAGQTRDAVSMARRARDVAPELERVWRLLLEALAAAGDTIGMALESAALSTRLSQDGRDPEPATRALLERATADRQNSESTGEPSLIPALIGREDQFHRVLTAWDDLGRHRGRHLHVSAGPGLGKTRLLRDLHHRLRSRGAPTIAVRATPGDRNIPFSLAAELARALCQLPGSAAVSQGSAAALVALNPTLTNRYSAAPDNSAGLESVRRRSGALSELLGAVSEEQSCVLLLDDLHWADHASLQVLRPLLDRVSDCSSLIVTASRSGVGVMEPEDPTRLIPLPPLTVKQLSELMGSLATLPSGLWAEQLPELLHRNTDGVPLLVLEAIQLSIERGTLRIAVGMWQCTDWDELKRQLGAESALRQRLARLEPEASRILLGLAVGGIALSVPDVMQVSFLTQSVVERALTTLEQKGLIHRSGDRWQSGHDEISATALDRADPAVLTGIHASLGRVFAASAGDPRTLVRAGRHLALAQEWSDLRRVFLRFVQLLRREGDARRIRYLAGDFLEGMPDATVDRLLRTFGRLNHLRYELARPQLVAGVVLLLGGVAAAAALSRPPTPEAVLFLHDTKSHPGALLRLPLWSNRWESGQAIDIAWLERTPLPGRLETAQQFLAAPDGKSWAASIKTGDSNTTDVVVIDGDDRVTPLVTGLRDDNVASWLPDGSGLLITTARWSPPDDDDYDLAVRSLTGSLRQLTSTRDHDAGGFPSPDGTRVAVLRVPKDGSRRLCIIPFNGPAGPCAPDSLAIGELLGWADAGAVLSLRHTMDGLYQLIRTEVDGRHSTMLLDAIQRATTSPDGKWIAYSRLPPGRSAPSWFVAPMAALTSARELLGVERGRYEPIWRVSRGLPYLEKLSLVRPEGALPSHFAYQLRSLALDNQHRTMDLPLSLTWTSADTSIATVDSSGLLRPRREGSTVITVSASGWRSDTATVRILASPLPAIVMQEDWSHDLRNWYLFGTPSPKVIGVPGAGRAFWNQGDGRYSSGAYSRARWSGQSGIGVEADISVPVTMPHWQQATVGLFAGFDSVAIGPEAHRTGIPPINSSLGCEMGFPAGEGTDYADKFSVNAGGTFVMLPVDSSFSHGRWMRLRIQIFPDGTCGVALDGHPLWRSRVPVLLDSLFVVVLGTASAGTRVLHGHLTTWTGVRADVDWPELGYQGVAP